MGKIRKTYALGLLTILLLSLAGCGGGGGDAVPVYTARIYSDQPTDGDISYDSVDGVYTISNGPASLFFGIDDLNPHFPEYRAFLDFPLDGSTGSPGIPASVGIVSASLEVFVNEVSFAPRIPTLIDLVSYPLTGLEVADFTSQPLRTLTVNFYPEDQGAFVSLDITPLMQEAQRLGLSDLQLRLLLDLSADSGFVGLDDRPTVSLTAPQLIVNYIYP